MFTEVLADSTNVVVPYTLFLTYIMCSDKKSEDIMGIQTITSKP